MVVCGDAHSCYDNDDNHSQYLLMTSSESPPGLCGGLWRCTLLCYDNDDNHSQYLLMTSSESPPGLCGGLWRCTLLCLCFFLRRISSLCFVFIFMMDLVPGPARASTTCKEETHTIKEVINKLNHGQMINPVTSHCHHEVWNIYRNKSLEKD